MSPVLTIIGPTCSPDGGLTQKTLVHGELSIGRSQDNDWALEDPLRHIGRHHCRIIAEQSQFRLLDLSQNGVFLNHSPEPIGNGHSVTLKDGDKFSVGGHTFSILIEETSCVMPLPDFDVPAPGPAPRIPSPPHEPDRHVVQFDDILPLSEKGSEVLAEEKIPPFPELTAGAPVLGAGTTLDHGAPTHDALSIPRSEDLIPADFEPTTGDTSGQPVSGEDVQSSVPVAARSREVPPERRVEMPAAPDEAKPRPDEGVAEEAHEPGRTEPSPEVRLVEVTPLPAAAGVSAPTLTSDRDIAAAVALLLAAGVDRERIQVEHPKDLIQTVGSLLRILVSGVMSLLATRMAIKKEVGVETTEFRRAENNPLKFSIGPDDAIDKLFLRRERGFVAAEEAFEEAFEDLRQHQMAVLGGMQNAWMDLLQRFDPKSIEAQITQEGGLAGFLAAKLVSHKAQCWDVFVREFDRIAEDSEFVFRRRLASEYERLTKSERQNVR